MRATTSSGTPATPTPTSRRPCRAAVPAGHRGLPAAPVRKGTDTAKLRGEAATLRQRKARQMQLHAAGAIDDADLTEGMRALRDRLEVVTRS